jgi:hypothetical protein
MWKATFASSSHAIGVKVTPDDHLLTLVDCPAQAFRGKLEIRQLTSRSWRVEIGVEKDPGLTWVKDPPPR